MSKYLDESAIEPIAEPFTHSQQTDLPPPLPPHSEVALTSPALCDKMDETPDRFQITV